MQKSVPAKTDKNSKKKRLSSALRENLKRRKAAPRPKKSDVPPQTS